MTELKSLLRLPPETVLPGTLDQKEEIFDGIAVAMHVTRAEKIASLQNPPGVEPRTGEYSRLEVYDICFDEPGRIHAVCDRVMRKAAHPCLLILSSGEQGFLAVCRTEEGGVQSGAGAKRRIPVSHFLYPDQPTSASAAFLGTVSAALCEPGTVSEISRNLVRLIGNFSLGGISGRTWLQTLIRSVRPELTDPELNDLIRGCWCRKRANVRYGYSLVYDTEEIWHRLMQDPQCRERLLQMQIRDMEDLLFYCEAL